MNGNRGIDLSDYNPLTSNSAPGGYGPAAVPEAASALLAMLLVNASARVGEIR